jgi:antitoxin component of RelBE/YafQ-DinJ toxin-antitoxin module
MIHLSQETEALATRLAAALSLSVDDAIRLALEEKARAVGIVMEPRHPRDRSPEAVAARHVRIPIYSGRALRHEAGRRYDLMSATIPI